MNLSVNSIPIAAKQTSYSMPQFKGGKNLLGQATFDVLDGSGGLKTEFIREALNGLRGVSDDVLRRCSNLMKSYPDIVKRLMEYKNTDGSQMFSSVNVAEIFINCAVFVKYNSERIFQTLNGRVFKQNSVNSGNKAVNLWCCLREQKV